MDEGLLGTLVVPTVSAKADPTVLRLVARLADQTAAHWANILVESTEMLAAGLKAGSRAGVMVLHGAASLAANLAVWTADSMDAPSVVSSAVLRAVHWA